MSTKPRFQASATILLVLTLAGCAMQPMSDQAQPKDTPISVFEYPTHWQAFSRTANSITGDITLADTKLTFANQASVNLEIIEHNADTGQTLFKVTSKNNPALLNGNLLCGSKPVDYLVTQISGDAPGQSDMQLMAYYYPEQLRLAKLPLKNLDDRNRQMCALYTYVGADANSGKAK